MIFLHSEIHQDASDFIRQTLTNADFLAFLTSNNFIIWGAIVHAVDGCEAAEFFSAAAFPFLGVYAVTAQSTVARPRYQRVWAHEGGYVSATDLLAKMREKCGAALTTLETVAAERASREYERRLREEQDRDFREAEERDIRRMRELEVQSQREAEERREAQAREAHEAAAREEEQRRKEEEAELLAAIELSRQLHRESEIDEARKRLLPRKEPAQPPQGTNRNSDGIEVSNIRFTLPSGARLQRRFDANEDTIATIRDYILVASHECGHPLWHFDFGTNFPKRSFTEEAILKGQQHSQAMAAAGNGSAPAEGPGAMTLKGAGLFPQAMIFVTQSASQVTQDKKQKEEDARHAAEEAARSSSGASGAGGSSSGAGAPA
jgi:UBX domain